MNVEIYNKLNDTNLEILSKILLLIKNGGAVPHMTLQNLQHNCNKIFYINQNDEIISTGALKNDRPLYRNNVFYKASFAEKFTTYMELGYVATSSCHLQQGFAKAICKKIIQNFPNINIFATTKIDNVGMQKILTELGFIVQGNSYQSLHGDYNINLLIKTI